MREKKPLVTDASNRNPTRQSFVHIGHIQNIYALKASLENAADKVLGPVSRYCEDHGIGIRRPCNIYDLPGVSHHGGVRGTIHQHGVIIYESLNLIWRQRRFQELINSFSARAGAKNQHRFSLAGLLENYSIAESPDIEDIPYQDGLEDHDTPSIGTERRHIEDRYYEKRPEPDGDRAAECRLPGSKNPLNIIQVKNIEGYRIQDQGKRRFKRIDDDRVPSEIYPKTNAKGNSKRYQHDIAKEEEPPVPGKTQGNLYIRPGQIRSLVRNKWETIERSCILDGHKISGVWS